MNLLTVSRGILFVLVLASGVGHGADPQPTGGLKGRLIFDGDVPVPAALDIPNSRSTLKGEPIESDELAHYGSLGLKDPTLIVDKKGGLANAIVWISDKSVPIPPLPPNARLPQPATLKFEAGRLQPQVLAWWGPARPLALENKDRFPINLRNEPILSQPFNRMVITDKSAMVTTEGEWRPLLVRSDVMHWLPPAVIFPCVHPYFAVSDLEGNFALNNLPPGEWEFTAWHQRSGWLRTTAWPKGKFKQKIEAEVVDLGEVKLSPELFETKK